ncbi:MAG: SixA phosphatase family protein [Methylophilaceae bacterium]
MESLPAYKSIMLWRHADALPIGGNINDDLSRPLSKKGQQQAKTVAAWLKRYSPKDTMIVSSNAVRSQQTAQALTNDFKLSAGLAPGSSLTSILDTINGFAVDDTIETNLLIVGHQPWLGALAAYLLNPMQQSDGLNIKKAALWWFKQTAPLSNDQFDLLTIQTPRLL